MHTALARVGFGASTTHFALFLLALAPGLYFANPAIGLLGGAVFALIVGRNPVANSTRMAKLALQVAVVLLGLTMSASALVEHASTYGLALSAYVLATLAIGLGIGWLMRVDLTTAALITIGTAICGGTAIAVAAPLMRSAPPQLAIALGAVFLLNMVALLVFPQIGLLLEMTQAEFGSWAALAVHDTSSVVATAAVFGEEATEVATTVKLSRTLWLIPLVIALGVWKQGERGTAILQRIRIPMFVVLFVAAAVLASVVSLPTWVIDTVATTAKLLLTAALFLVGLELTRETLAGLSGRSGVFAVALWVVMAPIALLFVYLSA